MPSLTTRVVLALLVAAQHSPPGSQLQNQSQMLTLHLFSVEIAKQTDCD